MDVISLGKAMKTLRDIKKLDEDIIAKEAEAHFKTVDHRLDWIEGQADKIMVSNSHQVDLSLGEFDNVEVVNSTLRLKQIGTSLEFMD